jgi:hypothetical protein
VINKFGFDDGFVLDVTDYEAWMELKAYTIGKYGRIDVLVNNAGSGVNIADTVDQTCETIDRTIAVNLNSVIYGSQLIGEVMRAQGDGIIINVSSVCARHAWGGWSVYAAAKAGVDSVEHGAYLNEETLHAMQEAGAVWVPTLSTIGNLRGKGRFCEEAVCAILDSALANVEAFAAMGGLLAPGTDAGAWAVPHGCLSEYELFGQLFADSDAVLSPGILKLQERF